MDLEGVFLQLVKNSIELMKRFTIFSISVALLLNLALNLKAQPGDNSAYLPISVVAARQQNIPEAVNTYIEDKLNQVVIQNGLGSADYLGRFVLTASIVPVTKDIIAGPPKKFSEIIDITFYIVDNIDKKVFSSTTVSAKAVDASEEKVLSKAIRSINVKSPQIVGFVDKGRNGIIDYYSQQADIIIATAQSLAKQRRFEAAFYELNSIPEACGIAYDKAIAAATVIFQEYVNYSGEINLAKARSAWVAQQNSAGAALAGEYLSKILPDAKCYGKAESLYNEIKSKVREDWLFEMKVYQDDVSIEKARIDAWKQIGVAYGKNQKSDQYSITWLVR